MWIKGDQRWPLAIIWCHFALRLGGTSVRQSCWRAPAIRRASWRLYAKATSTEDRKIIQNHSHQSYESVQVLHLVNYRRNIFNCHSLPIRKVREEGWDWRKHVRKKEERKAGQEARNLLRLAFFWLAGLWAGMVFWCILWWFTPNPVNMSQRAFPLSTCVPSLWCLVLDLIFNTPPFPPPEAVETCAHPVRNTRVRFTVTATRGGGDAKAPQGVQLAEFLLWRAGAIHTRFVFFWCQWLEADPTWLN